MSFIKLTDLDLAGKRVLIRADLNVDEGTGFWNILSTKPPEMKLAKKARIRIKIV